MIPAFAPRLLALVPSLGTDRCSPSSAARFIERLSEDAELSDVIKRLAIELQCLAGSEVQFGFEREVRSGPGHYRIVCSYQFEQVAQEAFALALDVVTTLTRGTALDFDSRLQDLKEIGEDCAIGTSTGAVLAAARQRGIPIIRMIDTANLFQLGWGSRQKRLQATVTGNTRHIAVDIASDKQLTKTLLEQAGLPVPDGESVRTVEQALRVAEDLGSAVTVKPLDANQGNGVTVFCQTPDDVRRAFAHAREYSRRVIVEQFLRGRDYRVLVTGNTIAAASWRRPPFVVGDGMSSVRELVAAENANPARGIGHTNILTRIPLDEIAQEMLQRSGYGLDSVPHAGAMVELRGNAYLSTGGTAEDVTDLLPRLTIQICLRAARTIGLDVAGIDIVCEDIARPLTQQGGGIIEVNAAPGIRMHQYPSRGQARDAGAAIVDALFGKSDGRIPTIAVTGTNGKTTTTRLIEHVLRMTGRKTGMTTTDGVYINGELNMQGDCTGYHSARSLLTAPDVDFAVLETARGGILKRGLAFDSCDVSVVLNVTADHLGMDGVDSLDELALVKEVVARVASRAVVLNANDSLCVEMAGRMA